MPTSKANAGPIWTVDERRYFVRDHGSLIGCKILFAEEGRVAHAVAQERVVFELFRGVEELWRILRDATTDRPWEGKGPSVEEAGGDSILVRWGDRDLHRCAHRDGAWRTEDGDPVSREVGATGWRPMPKVNP